MKLKINSSYRLATTSYLEDSSYSEQYNESEVDAAFDKTRSYELTSVQLILKKNGVVFRLDKYHLFHKSNPHDISDDIKKVLLTLEQNGYKPVLKDHSVLNNLTFGIRCSNDLVFQRLKNDLRIYFYTI